MVHPLRVDRYIIGGASGYSWIAVRQDQIASSNLDGIFLEDEQLTPFHSDEYHLRLVRDLLDQQIIDSQGRKVVRVNDVTFDIVREGDHDALHVLEVDIGLRSLFRRLVQGTMQRRIPPNSIRWDLCNIVEPDPQRRLRLNISMAPLEKMHPADLADIVEDLSPEDREAIFEAIDPESAAEALSEMEPEVQAQILESLEAEVAADILEEMDPDEAADALNELHEETSDEILEEMEGEPKADVEELLEYDEDTAGGMMNTEYVALHELATVADALDALRQNQDLVDVVTTLFVTDLDGRLKAALPVARVFLARPATPLAELIVDAEVIKAKAGAKSRKVLELFDRYNILTLPVVDDEGRMAGVVTADDVISVLRRK